MKIAKLLAIDVPVPMCNLKCHYCYITQQDGWKAKREITKYDPDFIERAYAPERFGGVCLVNLTGDGETLIPPEMPEIIKRFLKLGHYLEVVTNGTLTKRFEEIAEFDSELLSHLEFKFSFHYLELKRLNMIDVFFNNVKLMRSKGCSFTIEFMPTDEAMPYIEEIKKICYDEVGALCQLTIGRDDTDGRKILTKLSREDYLKTWSTFASDMFKLKWDLFNVKRKEFCYAGMWSLHLDLATGEAQQCYGIIANQNIYKDLSKPVIFRPVGCGCNQPFCFNGHAYITLGMIPELDAPTYYDVRSRMDKNGRDWFSPECKIAFSQKMIESNSTLSNFEKIGYYLTVPLNWARMLWVKKHRIPNKIMRLLHING